MTTNIIFIHGANATQRSFNYILRAIKQIKREDLQVHFFNYDHHHGFARNFPVMLEKLDAIKGECMIVAHSMGGIYAMHLYGARPDRIKRAVTMATPFAGVTNAMFMRWVFPWYKLISDSAPTSSAVAKLNEIRVTIPWTQIVSMDGDQPWVTVFTRNDGVVSRLSMTSRKDINYIYLDTNHYEILSDQTSIDVVLSELEYLVA